MVPLLVYFKKQRPASPWLRKILLVVIIVISLTIILDEIKENSSLNFRIFHIPHLSLRLNKRELFLAKGQEFKLRVLGLNRRVDSYSSTDFKVAYVNFNGRVYGARAGNAFISVEVDDVVLKCRVNVLDINRKKLILKVGEEFQLKIKENPGKITYTNSNPEIITVSKKGKIMALAEGTSVITAKCRGLTFRCKVTVKETKK